MTADILEIFSSVQGEGPFTGVKQIFIRFHACNAKCTYCDIDKSLSPKKFSVEKLLSIIKQLNFEKGRHHSVSLTGGEPLLYKDYLKVFLPMLKEQEKDIKVYLETNGTLPDVFSEIRDEVDIVAMDLKLPSSAADKKEFWAEHEKFLALVVNKKDFFVKVIVANDTKREDIEKAVNLVSRVDREILMVLQPIWPKKDEPKVKTTTLFNYLFLAEKKLENVRVMPQMHKVLGIR